MPSPVAPSLGGCCCHRLDCVLVPLWGMDSPPVDSVAHSMPRQVAGVGRTSHRRGCGTHPSRPTQGNAGPGPEPRQNHGPTPELRSSGKSVTTRPHCGMRPNRDGGIPIPWARAVWLVEQSAALRLPRAAAVFLARRVVARCRRTRGCRAAFGVIEAEPGVHRPTGRQRAHTRIRVTKR